MSLVSAHRHCSLLVVVTLAVACTRDSATPPSPPPGLEPAGVVRELAAKSEAALPAVRFAWPARLRLRARTAAEHMLRGQGGKLRQATLAYEVLVDATRVNDGMVVSVHDVQLGAASGDTGLVNALRRNAAPLSSLSFKVTSDGRYLGLVEGGRALEALRAALVAYPLSGDAMPARSAERLGFDLVEQAAAAVWSSLAGGAVQLVALGRAGHCVERQGAGRDEPGAERMSAACGLLRGPVACGGDGASDGCVEVLGANLTGGALPAAGVAQLMQSADAPLELTAFREEVTSRVVLSQDELVPTSGDSWDVQTFSWRAVDGASAAGWATSRMHTEYGREEAPAEGSKRTALDAACQGGAAVSCYDLGLLYGNGEDGPVSLALARRFVGRACELGHAPACELHKGMRAD